LSGVGPSLSEAFGSKQTIIKENLAFEIRAEFFNIPKRAQFHKLELTYKLKLWTCHECA